MSFNYFDDCPKCGEHHYNPSECKAKKLENKRFPHTLTQTQYIEDLERQLEQAREAQNKLGEWVYQYIHCMRTVDYCGSLEDALEMEQYLYELKEKGE